MSSPKAHDPSRAIYSVRAKHKGEALAHNITRAAFLRHVIADPRTRDLFAFWGQETGVDAVVDMMIDLLDAAARRAGISHRSALRRQEEAHHLIPILGVLQRHEEESERLLAGTQEARAAFAVGWVVAELYGTLVDEEVPIKGWLAADLMIIFRWEVAARVYGEPVALMVGPRPTLDVVPKGQRPKGAGEHLVRNAEWYYRAEVQLPKATHAELAREYRERKEAAGEFLAPKDRKDIHERADTSTIREGISEAKRLLQLPVPSEQWHEYLRVSGLITGEKTPS